MAERRKLGCFSVIAILLAVGFIGSVISGNRDTSSRPDPSQPTNSLESQSVPEVRKTETSTDAEEPKTEAELQTEKVCLISKSGDTLTRKFIVRVGEGTARYTDHELMRTSIKTLQTSMANNPAISQELEVALLEQIDLRRAIINHILAVESYDDINQYLSDFSKINQNYLRHEEVSDICGY